AVEAVDIQAELRLVGWGEHDVAPILCEPRIRTTKERGEISAASSMDEGIPLSSLSHDVELLSSMTRNGRTETDEQGRLFPLLHMSL
ncbi:hypothetical protein, partial [Pseudomonas sp. HMSC75E02]